jgi:hypothetical protein
LARACASSEVTLIHRALLLAAGLLTATPVVLRGPAAQDLAQLFKDLSGITIYGFAARLSSPGALRTADGLLHDPWGLRGVGFELLVEVDSTATWAFELGLGYEHVTGFVAPPSAGLDLRGSLRTVPRLSLYAAPTVTVATVRPYVTLNTGLVQLRTVRAYDSTGVQYGLEGDTFEFGLGAGLIHESGLFLEATYRNRALSSVDYKFPPGTSAVPPGWPRALNFTGFQVSFGYQSGRLRRPGAHQVSVPRPRPC